MKRSLRCVTAALVATVGLAMSPTGLASADPLSPTTPVIPTPQPLPEETIPDQGGGGMPAPPVQEVPVPQVPIAPAPPVQEAPPPVVEQPHEAVPAPQPPPVQELPEPEVPQDLPAPQPAPEPEPQPTIQEPEPEPEPPVSSPVQEPEVPQPDDSAPPVTQEPASPDVPVDDTGTPSEEPTSQEVPLPPIQSVPPEESTTESEPETETGSEPSVNPSPSTSGNPNPDAPEPSIATATTEPPPPPAAATVQPEPEANPVSDADLKQAPPAAPEVATAETVSEVEDVFAAYRSSHDEGRKDDRDHDKDGRDHDRDRDHDWPKKDRDPKGWKCDDHRGPHGCKWNDWDHDDRGRPVFYNRYSFDIKVLYLNHQTGERVEVVVKAGTRRPIDVRHPGDYGFVVVGASSHNYAVNVAVGTFSRWDNCDRSRSGHHNCHESWRSEVRDVDVRVLVNNVVYPRWPARAYYCGCDRDKVVIYQDNRTYNYNRVFINGTREVVGTWVQPQGQPKYFVPKGYKRSPVDQNYTWGVPPEFQGVLGGDNPTGEDVQAAPAVDENPLRDAILIGTAAFVVVAAAGSMVWAWRRRRGTSG